MLQNKDFLEKDILEAQLKKLLKNSRNGVIKYHCATFWQKFPEWVQLVESGQRPFIIAISGASGSGKSFLRKQLMLDLVGNIITQAFTQDNYYIDFESAFPNADLDSFYDEINLDDPQYIRFSDLAKDLSLLKSSPIGNIVHIPKFRFGTPERLPGITEETIEITVPPILITEGIHAFYDEDVTCHYDLKIFVDVDEDTRKERWIKRNLKENRGTTDNMWQTTVECLETHIFPGRAKADIVLDNSQGKQQLQILLNELLYLLQCKTADNTSFEADPSR